MFFKPGGLPTVGRWAIHKEIVKAVSNIIENHIIHAAPPSAISRTLSCSLGTLARAFWRNDTAIANAMLPIFYDAKDLVTATSTLRLPVSHPLIFCVPGSWFISNHPEPPLGLARATSYRCSLARRLALEARRRSPPPRFFVWRGSILSNAKVAVLVRGWPNPRAHRGALLRRLPLLRYAARRSANRAAPVTFATRRAWSEN